MAALCRFCNVETYLSDAHPCCAYWNDLQPSEPCLACNAPRPPRRKPEALAYEAVKPFRCSTCGLSEVGVERLVASGFSVSPCGNCVERFDRAMASA